MTINPTLFKAILSMDAYNRGYDRAINLDAVLNTTQIGTAIITTSRDQPDAQAIGFYALAYQVKDENGIVIDTVISYRGTDDQDEPTSLDQANGWLVGGGVYGEPQANMAIEFYKLVAAAGNHISANISLTGHSLGGGLAGYVGALYDQDAKVFDSMAFQLAANDNELEMRKAA